MPKAKPLGKELILAAMAKTKSNKAAARYLNCSYIHYKKWAKTYDATEKGYSNLFEQHKNQSGKGIPKFLSNSGKEPALLDIIEGRVPMTNFSPDKVKKKLFQEGYLKEECGMCKFNERRVLDYKSPLLLNFKDKNKRNYRLENLEVLCYNHYFLTVGDIFSDKQIEQIEDYKPVNEGETTWELDEYQMQRLKELGLYDLPSNIEDGSEFISRI
jgi:hypothetical protein